MNHRAALALRMSAQAVRDSHAALGGYYRRMRAKLGGPKAITARLVYHVIKTQQSYQESIFLKHEASHRERVHKRLHAQAAALGFRLVPATVVP